MTENSSRDEKWEKCLIGRSQCDSSTIQHQIVIFFSPLFFLQPMTSRIFVSNHHRFTQVCPNFRQQWLHSQNLLPGVLVTGTEVPAYPGCKSVIPLGTLGTPQDSGLHTWVPGYPCTCTCTRVPWMDACRKRRTFTEVPGYPDTPVPSHGANTRYGCTADQILCHAV